MGLFKKKIVKEIHDGIWGHMVNKHGIDVDTLSRDMRCVERDGTINGGLQVKLIRVFRPIDAANKGIEVTSWETFDEHPDLILYEGFLRRDNLAYLEKK